MQNKFYFYKGEKNHEFNIKANNIYQEALKQFSLGKDFEIVIQDIQQERSPKQLRGFWKLIECIREYLEDKGEFLFKDEIKTFFLEKSGHVKVIEGVTIARSISNNSGTTKEEMAKIITTILNFAIDRNIENCYLEDQEYRDLINYYQ